MKSSESSLSVLVNQLFCFLIRSTRYDMTMSDKKSMNLSVGVWDASEKTRRQILVELTPFQLSQFDSLSHADILVIRWAR